ncbi:MAG: NUDIX domain-containing protein [Nitriliruptoraceae bacterium]
MTHNPGGLNRDQSAIASDVLRALRQHEPRGAAERSSLDETLAWLAHAPAPFDEHADRTHVTASAIVMSRPSPPLVLMHHHKRLGRWLQPGGHIDTDEDPATAAIREVGEETGIAASHPPGGPRIVHVDVHPGPKGHRHLDLRYVLEVSGNPDPAPQRGESRQVQWMTFDKVLALADPSLRSALDAAVDAICP